MNYKYSAMDGRGKESRGFIDADSDQEAASKLKQLGLFPTCISEATEEKVGFKGKTPKVISLEELKEKKENIAFVLGMIFGIMISIGVMMIFVLK